jgi:uncharacterized protein YndB with AHSA1/START domain
MKKYPFFGLALLVAVGAVLLAPMPLSPARVQNSTLIERPPSEVYRYVTTPGNWPRWHPSSLAVSGATDHPLLVGEQVSEEFLVAGYQGTVVWTVVQRQAPLHWSISGKIANGGSGKVSYRLTQVEGGTRFEREFEYARPNLLFALADWFSLRAKVTAESAEALRRLKAVLEGPATAPRTAGITWPRAASGG